MPLTTGMTTRTEGAAKRNENDAQWGLAARRLSESDALTIKQAFASVYFCNNYSNNNNKRATLKAVIDHDRKKARARVRSFIFIDTRRTRKFLSFTSASCTVLFNVQTHTEG